MVASSGGGGLLRVCRWCGGGIFFSSDLAGLLGRPNASVTLSGQIASGPGQTSLPSPSNQAGFRLLLGAIYTRPEQ